MFINNAHPSLTHHMVMNYLQTYKDIKEKGMSLEKGLIKDGVIRLYKESTQDHSSNNNKSQYWNKNKNTITDGATDTRQVHIVGAATNVPNTPCQQQTYQQQSPTYQQPPMQTPQQMPAHHNQANAITLAPGNKPRVQRQPCTYTPLGEPLDAIFEKLAKDNLVRYLQTQPMEPNQARASWYKDNEYYKFHRVKGHTTLKCMQLKDYVQDLINQKEITVGAQPSPNVGLMMYQNAFPPHNTNPGKAPANPPANKPNNTQGKQGDN